MSGYKSFAVLGAGGLAPFIVKPLLNAKDAGDATEVVLVTRLVCTSQFPFSTTV